MLRFLGPSLCPKIEFIDFWNRVFGKNRVFWLLKKSSFCQNAQKKEPDIHQFRNWGRKTGVLDKFTTFLEEKKIEYRLQERFLSEFQESIVVWKNTFFIPINKQY